MSEIWAGVDVGGRRKGFHVAAVGDGRVVVGPEQLADAAVVTAWVKAVELRVVAIDCPRSCADPGEGSRAGERALMKEICGIRWTPERSKLGGNPYYELILNGLDLYDALSRRGGGSKPKVIEVFPTASWTIWAGRRGKRSRAAWSRAELKRRRLHGLPTRRLNQDDRDALAAALTARQYDIGEFQKFGEIVVPTR